MPRTIPLYHTKLFKRGNFAQHNGNTYVIDHVSIRGEQLFVYLEGVRDPVAPDDLSMEVTVIDFNRENGGPRAWVNSNASSSKPVQDQFVDDDFLNDFLA